jgi:hypothetical protein
MKTTGQTQWCRTSSEKGTNAISSHARCLFTLSKYIGVEVKSLLSFPPSFRSLCSTPNETKMVTISQVPCNCRKTKHLRKQEWWKWGNTNYLLPRIENELFINYSWSEVIGLKIFNTFKKLNFSNKLKYRKQHWRFEWNAERHVRDRNYYIFDSALNPLIKLQQSKDVIILHQPSM